MQSGAIPVRFYRYGAVYLRCSQGVFIFLACQGGTGQSPPRETGVHEELAMKRIIILFVVCCIFGTVFMAQRRKKAGEYPPLSKEQISVEALWRRITEEEDYEDYPFWPGHEGICDGQSPHGVYHQVYIHPVLMNALPIKDGKVPNGSIIVKENMNSRKKIDSYTIMVKVDGYNPEAGDWFWMKLDKKGNTIVEGKPGPCIACHEPLKSNDYIILYRLDRDL